MPPTSNTNTNSNNNNNKKPTLAQKLESIHTYLRATGTCHTLKDLEKSLPAANLATTMTTTTSGAGSGSGSGSRVLNVNVNVNSVQVRDLIQQLVDDSKVRVEKIGSGNWYWSFVADEIRDRERALEGLRREAERVGLAVGELEGRVAVERERVEGKGKQKRKREPRFKGDGNGDGSGDGNGNGEGGEEDEDEEGDGEDDEDEEKVRRELVEKVRVLEGEVGRLKGEERRRKIREKDLGSGSWGERVETMKREIERFRAEAGMWTEDLYVLEEWMLKRLLLGDRSGLEDVKRLVYGSVPGEWTEEGGLREL